MNKSIEGSMTSSMVFIDVYFLFIAPPIGRIVNVETKNEFL
jgi:hypothetical protein